MKLILLLFIPITLTACTSQTTTDESLSPNETEFREVLPCLGLKLSVDTETSDDRIIFSVETKNLCNEQLDWLLGYEPPHDVIVTKDNTEVWRFTGNDPVPAPLAEKTYGSAEGETFTAEWTFIDNEGDAVARGKYKVIGLLIGASMTDAQFEQRVETSMLEVSVK